MTKCNLVILMISLFCLCSCATLFNWEKNKMVVETFPKGASVEYNGTVVGETPCVVDVKRKGFRKQNITLKKEGFATARVSTVPKIDPAFWLNGIFVFVTAPVDLITSRITNTQKYDFKTLKNKDSLTIFDSIPDAKNLSMWDEEFPLVKSHFQGKIPKTTDMDGGSSKAAAAITSSIYYSYQIHDSYADFCSFSAMNRKKSWCAKNLSGRKKEILKHEKAHFDITEIYSREFKKKLLEAKPNKSNFKAVLQKTLSDCSKKLAKTQARYDKETNHSLNKATQFLWEEKIKAELDSTNKFSEPIFKISW